MSNHTSTAGFGGADAYLRAEIDYRVARVREDWGPVRRRSRRSRAAGLRRRA